jgi:hypothetical protein
MEREPGRGRPRSARGTWLPALATLAVALVVLLAAGPAQALAQEPALSIDDVVVDPEGPAGTPKTATFTITLSQAAASDVTVRYLTANATAVAPVDYVAVTSTLVTIAAGTTSKPVTVTVNGDAVDEIDETFEVQLNTPTGATIADATAVGTIVDDDPPPALSVNDPLVSESGGNLVFAVTLSAASGKTVTVDYATADGTATSAGAFDYTAVSGTLTFVPGVTTQNVSVPISSDSLDELDETVLLNLTLPAGSPATIADNQGTGTIDDDDGPTISIGDVTVDPEGATGTTQTATFTITLSAASVQDVTVRYGTANGTAVSPADYTAIATTTEVTIPAGQLTTTVTATVNGDALDEVNETFEMRLNTPSNATILDGIGVATIVDDDELPTLSVSDPSVAEGTGTSRNLVFTVTLAPASGRTVTVDYATADGTAVSTGSPLDYTARTGTLSFSPGVTTLTVSVALTTDSIDELDETLFLDLTLPAGSPATIAKARGTGTISDDDGPTIAVNDITVPEGDSGSSEATFTVTLSATSVQPVSVKVVTANDTAVAPGDYTAIPATPVTTLVIPAGELTKTFGVVVNGDAVDEADERFRVTLSEAVGGTLADATGLATITDDDASPVMRIEDVSINEGSVGATNVVLTVSLDRPSERTIIVAYTTADVSATAGVDYGESSEVLTFNAGQTSRTITIPIGPDGAVENDETFTVTLTTPSNATLGKGEAVVTIVDDDLGPGTTPSLSVADVLVPAEGDTGTRPVTVTVRLASPPGRSVGVSYKTEDDTAKAPGDYAAASGRLEFAPGEMSKTFETTIQGDELVETDHSFKVTLSEPSNAAIADGSALVVITDDDVGLVKVDAPASVNASRMFCSSLRRCTGTRVSWQVVTRGRLIFEVTALAPRAKTKTRPAGTRYIPILRTTSTITRARSGTQVLRPTPGRRARRVLRRLRTAKAYELRVKVTFINRSGEAESRTERVKLNVRR